MINWNIGDKHILVKNEKFNLEVQRVKPKIINKNFHSEIFKFKVTLDFEDFHDKILHLNDSNIDFLKDGLENIFNKIKSSYKKRNGPFYIQMNLSFDGLKKEFLKSGIVDMFGDIDSKNVIFWVINMLDQVNQSSDNLIFSNNIFIDFIIIKTIKPKGKINDFSEIYNISKYANLNYKIVKQINPNYFFNNEIKFGFVDMTLYFKNSIIDDSFNCILVSTYFGLLFDKFNGDMKKNITLYKIKIHFIGKFS